MAIHDIPPNIRCEHATIANNDAIRAKLTEIRVELALTRYDRLVSEGSRRQADEEHNNKESGIISA